MGLSISHVFTAVHLLEWIHNIEFVEVVNEIKACDMMKSITNKHVE